MRLALTLSLWMGLAGPAAAGYVDAIEAYNAGQFEIARSHFEYMARLGHATSQHNLAIMLLRGEGGPSQPEDAFAWFSLAAEAGYDPARKIYSQMAPLAGAEDLGSVEELRKLYGIEASVERLSKLIGNFQPLRVDVARPRAFEYPYSARKKGRQGWVLIEVDTNAAGEMKDARAISGVNAREFADFAVAGIQYNLRQKPPDDRAVSRFGVLPVTFALAGTTDYGLVQHLEIEGRPGYSVDETLVDQLCEEGKRGDPRSLIVCGFMHMFDRRIGETDRQVGCQAIVRAALAGQPEAAMLVGSVLAGTSDPVLMDEGVAWWEVAAQNGSHAARARALDAWLHDGAIDDALVVRARNWILMILEGDDDWAIKHVVALLAAHPDQRIRDPERALDLMPRLSRRGLYDPQIGELSAAAYAALGRRNRAIWAQESAITLAGRRGWDISGMRRRLASYEAGGTWYGDLIREREAR